jgi:hypothetical protein
MEDIIIIMICHEQRSRQASFVIAKFNRTAEACRSQYNRNQARIKITITWSSIQPAYRTVQTRHLTCNGQYDKNRRGMKLKAMKKCACKFI